MRRCLMVVVILLLLSGLCQAADAGGSIQVELRCAGEPVDGGSLSLYCVGEWKASGLVLCRDFRDCTAMLDAPGPETARALAAYAVAHGAVGRTAAVGQAGTVCFDGLPAGLYLIVQAESAPGYEAIRPFLVLLTGDSEDSTVTAVPKMTPEEPSDPRLPQTGQLKWPVPLLLAAGLLLCAAGVTLMLRGRQRTR